MLGCCWWLGQELSSPACYCKAVQEHGSAGQTGLVAEDLLRGPQRLLVEKAQLVLRHLRCIMTLLTHGESYGLLQRDVKTKRQVIIWPF